MCKKKKCLPKITSYSYILIPNIVSYLIFVFIFQFTALTLNQMVEPNKEATFEYGFTPSEAFNSRPFGLTILLNYKDSVSIENSSTT
jgi:NADH:ubiquinone oxidoreductase subunit 3 (subunit A)